jgi:hypothetical protein
MDIPKIDVWLALCQNETICHEWMYVRHFHVVQCPGSDKLYTFDLNMEIHCYSVCGCHWLGVIVAVKWGRQWDNECGQFVILTYSCHHLLVCQLRNKMGKVYSLEYTDIPKVLFTTHHYVSLALMWSEVIVASWAIPALWSEGTVAQLCVPKNGVSGPIVAQQNPLSIRLPTP